MAVSRETLSRGGTEKAVEVPFWCIDMETDISGIDRIIRKCDKAFGCPVAMRASYQDILCKIHQMGKFIYAYAEEVLGYVALYANDMLAYSGYISLLAVRPEYQGVHIGTDLLETGMDMARKYGMQHCMLEVKRENEKAIKFYQSNGFVFREERQESFLLQRTLIERETYEYKRKKSNFACDGDEGL